MCNTNQKQGTNASSVGNTVVIQFHIVSYTVHKTRTLRVLGIETTTFDGNWETVILFRGKVYYAASTFFFFLCNQLRALRYFYKSLYLG